MQGTSPLTACSTAGPGNGAGVSGVGGAPGAGMLPPEMQMTYANPLFSLSLSPKQQRILHKTIFRKAEELHERNRRNSKSLERRKESLEIAFKLNSTKERGGSWSTSSRTSGTETRRLSIGVTHVPDLGLTNFSGEENQNGREAGGAEGTAITTVASALGVSERSPIVPRSPRVKSSLSLRWDRKEKDDKPEEKSSSELNSKVLSATSEGGVSPQQLQRSATSDGLDVKVATPDSPRKSKRSAKSAPFSERVDTEEERRKKRFMENLKLFKDVETTKSMQTTTEEDCKKRRGSEAGEDRPVIERSATIAGVIGGSGKRRARQHANTDSGSGKRAITVDPNLAATFIRSLSISSSSTTPALVGFKDYQSFFLTVFFP